jgi:hypothetical protein
VNGLALTEEAKQLPWYAESTVELRRLSSGTSTNLYEDKLVISSPGSPDVFDVTLSYRDTKTNAAYQSGRTFEADYRYMNEYGDGDMKLKMKCQFK